MNLHATLAIVVSFLSCTFILYALPRLAVRIGLVDVPTWRKHHTGSTPLIGGIAMFTGFVFGAIFLPISLQEFRALFAAAGLLVFMGILDDFRELSARSRLVGQAIAAVLITFWGATLLTQFGNLIDTGNLHVHGWISYVITLFAILSLINAFNMLDGLDGLAGSISLIAVSAFIILAILKQNFLLLYVLALLFAVLIAFLMQNWRYKKSAKVFMGDAGSTFLGLMLVWVAIYGTQQATPIISRPVTMLWILAIPLYELLSIFIYRLSQKRSPFSAGRDHVHYLLRDLGWSGNKIVFTFIFISLVCTSIGVIGEYQQWREIVMFSGFLLAFTFYFALHKMLLKRSKPINGDDHAKKHL